MADEVTVNLNITDAAALVDSNIALAEAVNEQSGAIRTATESMDSSAAAQQEAADAMSDASREISNAGANMHSDGSVSGVQSSLLDGVAQVGGDGDEGGTSDLLRTVTSFLSKRGGRLGAAASALENATDTIDRFDRHIRSVQNQLQDGGIVDSLLSTGDAANSMSRALDTVTSVGERLANGFRTILPAIAAVPVAIGAVSEGIDMLQAVRDVSISQTGDDSNPWLAGMEFAESWWNARFTGMDDAETQAVQQTLIENRAAFGSDQYKEGYEFSQNARLNYSMEAEKAANLYTRAVMRGTMTVGELTEALDNLKVTSGETGETMSQLVDSYSKSIERLGGVYGEGMGASIATDISQLGLSAEQTDSVTNLITQYQRNSHYGSLFSQMVTDNVTERGMSMGAATAVAAVDMSMQGFDDKNKQELVYQPLGETGETLNSLWEEVRNTGDATHIREVLENTYETNPGQYLNVVTLLQSTGIGNGMSSTPEDIANDMERLFKMEDNAERGINAGGEDTDVAALQAQADRWDWNLWDDGLVAGRIAGTIASGGKIGRTLNENDKEQRISNAFAGEGWEDDKDALDSALGFMVHENVVSASQFANVSDDERYDMVRDIVRSYNEEGGGDWMDYVRGHRTELSERMMESINAASQGQGEVEQIEAKIKVAIEGDLGDYLVEKYAEAQARRVQDNSVE